MSKHGKSLKALCKRLKVRLTVKRGKKRVYKSVAVLKRQCANKKKKKVKRKRKFGRKRKQKLTKKSFFNNIEASKVFFKELGFVIFVVEI